MTCGENVVNKEYEHETDEYEISVNEEKIRNRKVIRDMNGEKSVNKKVSFAEIVRNGREGRDSRGIMSLVHLNNNRRVNSNNMRMRVDYSHSF